MTPFCRLLATVLVSGALGCQGPTAAPDSGPPPGAAPPLDERPSALQPPAPAPPAPSRVDDDPNAEAPSRPPTTAEAAVAKPEPPLATFEAGRFDAAPADLPLGLLNRFLTDRLKAANAARLSELWGRRLESLPFAAELTREEVEDTRPTFVAYRDDASGRGASKLSVQWGFLDDALFEVRLDFAKRAPKLERQLETLFTRPPDVTVTLRDGARRATWHDGGLSVAFEGRRGHGSLLLADRARLERFERRLAEVDAAERLVWGSLEFFTHRQRRSLAAAREANRRAAELAPRFGDAWVNLCHVEYDAGELDQARGHCERALGVTGEASVRGEASYYLGLIALAEGDRQGGLELMRKAMVDVPRAWGIFGDLKRRVAALDGRVTDAILERAVYDYWCASFRDGSRELRIPLEFGFVDYEALSARADDELVDVDGQRENARQRCEPR